MGAKSKKQSYRQYKRRKKRIEKVQKYENKVESKTNEIKSIDDEIERLKLLKKKKEEERNKIKNEKFQELACCYNDKILLKEIVSYSEVTTFSHSTREDIKKKCEKGINTDDVDLEFLEKIVAADKVINKEISHTNMIGDIFNDWGASISFPGEEGDSDGT